MMDVITLKNTASFA